MSSCWIRQRGLSDLQGKKKPQIDGKLQNDITTSIYWFSMPYGNLCKYSNEKQALELWWVRQCATSAWNVGHCWCFRRTEWVKWILAPRVVQRHGFIFFFQHNACCSHEKNIPESPSCSSESWLLSPIPTSAQHVGLTMEQGFFASISLHQSLQRKVWICREAVHRQVGSGGIRSSVSTRGIYHGTKGTKAASSRWWGTGALRSPEV